MSYKTHSQPWTDPDLLADFSRAMEADETDDGWLLVRWKKAAPSTGGLNIILSAPAVDIDRATQSKLADLVRQKLSNGFFQSSREKGWPPPRFFVRTEQEAMESDWTYRLQLGPYRTEPMVIHPNKVMAIGDEQALSPLLGLECSDPVFGLPAKWITYSQADRAAAQGSLLFEASEVIMSHAIRFAETRMEHAVGQWEVVRWLTRALPTLDETACKLLENQVPHILLMVKSVLAEGLFLPEPDQFCELLSKTLALHAHDPSLRLEDIRKGIMGHNLHRWLDDKGTLNVVEWKGPAELRTQDHHRMLHRLSHSLEEAQAELASGTPVLMVDLSERERLAKALESLFPDLPILAWCELEDLSNIRILSTVDARLQVQPSVLPASFFSPE